MTFDGPIWEFDRQLFVTLNNAGFEALDGFMLLVSGTLLWIPLYAYLIFLLFKKFPTKNAIVGLAWVVVLIFLCDQLSVHAFKEVFERLRPCHEPLLAGQVRLVKESCGGQFGFVSSHATNTFGLAVFLGGLLGSKVKWLPVALLLWAALVSYSRIWLGVHYPLDILGGAVLGTVIARFLLMVANRAMSASSSS
ncbi:MAG: phosphatase PAP2 family protein [Bacteroidetes bacterium]|nr:MAG: phosphatase PAP2 family protein [Bacteroidota bacterium]